MTTDKFFSAAKKRFLLFAVEICVGIGVLILDLVSKTAVDAGIKLGSALVLIPNFLSFYYVRNDKAAFGSAFGLENVFGADGVRIFFIILTFLALGVIGYLMWSNRGKSRLFSTAIALVAAGAAGNLIDRMFLGYVRDFIQFTYFGLDLGILGRGFYIFNVADAALTVGIVLLAWYALFIYRPKTQTAEKVETAAIGAAGDKRGNEYGKRSGRGKNTQTQTAEVKTTDAANGGVSAVKEKNAKKENGGEGADAAKRSAGKNV